MDSSSFLPPNNNQHHHPPPPISHPSYADMIYRAIEALNEKNGSTKSAISNYIEQVYNHQLPPDSTHSTLLTHHLNHLKDNGLLHLVNNSYTLPRSLPPPPSSSLAPQSSRPRGRPRKLQAQPQARGSVVEQPNAEPVWAALGLSDEPQAVGFESESKGSGFPMKGVVGSEGMVSPRRRGRPLGSKNKKKPCRPVTAETSEAAAAVGAVAVASSGTKRRPGRPPKNQQATPIPFAPADEAPVAMDGGDGSVVAKSNAGASAAQGATSGITSQNVADVQDLKRILEYFQSKVRESLEVLKPHFTQESPVSVISAIQDLEVMGAMDLDAPPEDETLPQQPPQQQQHQPPQFPLAPQEQIYPHQFPLFQQPYQPQQYQHQNQQPLQQFQTQLPYHRTFNL